ncbi:MAG: Asp-tRNA(Asn)/Glu-tRNA(Gln) amidotransferase subunit GatB [Anaerolineae bacterium]|nr:Asp-tRNA(Asn)/Glu-tRNA(Gln) amidotransferase subunit GatB [Anaerolineae bacterium]
MATTFEGVIGLEVHAELLTTSKMFCGCAVVDSTTAAPNMHVCPICLGMPGVLPVINRAAVEYAIRVGLALNCEIAPYNVFARKSYFYPDQPKGFQISQYELPLAKNGYLMIDLPDGSTKRIGIRRAHLEEDTGKLMHIGNSSLVDFNRSGVPLLEIVSEPDIRTADEAEAYARKLRALLIYSGANTGDMSKGVLRMEPNISVRPVGSDEFRTRVEVKNLNSIKVLQKASAFEIARHAKVYEQGGTIKQATLGWDEMRQQTVVQREKESASDYRYFPEPDLPPLHISREWVEEIRQQLPEMPDAKRDRFLSMGLSRYEASVLVTERSVADWFEQVLAAGAEPKKTANWLLNEVFARMNKAGLDQDVIGTIKVTPAALAALIKLVDAGTINNNAAKTILDNIFEQGGEPAEWVKELGLEQTRDVSAVEAAVAKVMSDNPKDVDRFCAGEEKVVRFLMGLVMREGKGKFPADLAQQVLTEKLTALCGSK